MQIQSDLQSSLYEFTGTLANIQLGGLLNIGLLNDRSAPQSGTIFSPNGLLSQADAALTTFAQGGGPAQPVDYLGSGTISAVNLLGIAVFPRPVAVFSAGGTIYFLAPSGLPPLSGLLVSLNIDANAPFDLPDTAVVCFARGTMILTADGECAIETLQLGDRILTRDNGFQPLRWIGHRRLRVAELAARPNLRPIRIAAGAMGAGRPIRDLTLSPQHRVLMRGAETEFVTGETEVLVAAIHLLDMPGVVTLHPEDDMEYWHIMFDHHEILVSNGIESESLFASPHSLRALGDAACAELLAIFPDIAICTKKVHPRLARPQLPQRAARVLVQHVTASDMAYGKGQAGPGPRPDQRAIRH